MRTGGPSKALSLVALLLFVGLLAGCGGGNQSEQGGQGEAADGGAGGGQGDAAKKDAPETKIALGRVVSVKPDKRIVVIRTNKEIQGGERMVFKIRKNAGITLDGEKADVAAIEDDQQVQIEYIAKDKVDRALTVRLF
ncbi:MAG TPA: hypothetical protein VGP38_00975, partial [Rubrobacter sp.]|nr:hypothetical protein [Rubrobacter sp.]